MTVNQLHEITTALRAKKQGDAEVAIDHASFAANENGTILVVKSAKLRRLQGADDSGPIGPKFPFLVLAGDAGDEMEEGSEQIISNETDSELTNARFMAAFLLKDPVTHETLRPVEDPKNTEDGGFRFIVANAAGDRKWRHTIYTEEV